MIKIKAVLLATQTKGEEYFKLGQLFPSSRVHIEHDEKESYLIVYDGPAVDQLDAEKFDDAVVLFLKENHDVPEQ